jgi:hypothetical protein
MNNVESLTLVRHAPSAYNADKELRKSDPLYDEFKRSFNREYYGTGQLTDRTIELAQQIRDAHIPQTGDHNTPLAPGGYEQAMQVGSRLYEKIKGEPHVIYVSPYERSTE